MDVIDILMPTEEGRYIPQEVLEGILNQKVKFRLWVSTLFSGRKYALARNNVKKYALSQFVLMLDNDIILPEDAILKMKKFLLDNTDYGAIGLPKYDKSYMSDAELLHAQHVDMSCVLFRKDILDKVDFAEKISNPDFSGRCECAVCCFQIRLNGKKIGFLPSLHATHIENTRNV